jgi:hypothetical protein
MKIRLTSLSDDNVVVRSPFQPGDTVRTLHGASMTVILAFGGQVHCEWLMGRERHQRAFPASSLRVVFRYVPRAQ